VSAKIVFFAKIRNKLWCRLVNLLNSQS
jgi:hypothetical protein